MTSFSVWHADFDFSVKPPGSAKRRVEGVASVGGTDDHHVVSPLHAVHEREHLRHDAPLNLARHFFSLRAYGINFVDEDDGGCVFGCFVENFP